MITQHEIAELIDLYRLARTAGCVTRYDRLCWAAREFVKVHPEVKPIRAYKEVDAATR